MAQTKKRRRTKHRGNAAGIVESRGRTGRKPTAQERRSDAKLTAQQRREDRMNRPPTWRSAINRAAVSAVLFLALIVLFFKQDVGPALALGAFVFVFYVPLGYYTDVFVYRRRQRRKEQS